MEPKPSPPGGSQNRCVVPVFPLPNVYLFPGCVLPLHIFEPRYRQMIEDMLDRPGRLVMGTIKNSELDANGNPALFDVGGLGEIGRHERLNDGRFLVWLFGLSRVRLREVASSRLYRQVEIEPLVELAVPANELEDKKKRVQDALLARCPEFLNLPEDLPLTHLVDLLTQRIQMPCAVMQELFAETNLNRRVERVLCEHERRPTPPASA